MRLRLAIAVGRLVRALARYRGGGSAIPGRIAQIIHPEFLRHTIGRIPGGVVFVTGSNGKSTTTAMLVSVLRAHGLSVFTNPAGSNLPQGLASAVLADAGPSGRIDADIAVLEVDEAYGPMISQALPPDSLLVTNLQLDQLNRFAEPERVWQMMRTVAQRTGTRLIVNDREPALLSLGRGLTGSLRTATVSVADSVLEQFPQGLVAATLGDERGKARPDQEPMVVLRNSDGARATVSDSDGISRELTLPSAGLHWAIDALLALGTARELLGSRWSWEEAVAAFDDLAPVYGRGETVSYRGRDFEILMQKNLPSMRANLSTLESQPACLWVAVDEGTPDPSWIFDLDLGPISRVDVLTGSKAWQWATFLTYRDVQVGTVVESTKEAMDWLSSRDDADQPVTALVNYEQMMALRRVAGKKDLESLA